MSKNATVSTLPASERFTDEARQALRDEIEGAGGGEVFAVCRMSADGRIEGVEIVARGTDAAVPALAPFFEKGEVLVHNHPSGLLRPSTADVSVAAEAGSLGVGSYIVDNSVERVFIVAEPVRAKPLKALDIESLAGVLDTGGKLSARMPSFEPRASQISMTKDVARVFSYGGILAAEAGTGVGKSFAYLLPAIAWTIGNKEKVVVSTATINLQDQLFAKDIPLVASLFKSKPKAVLVKGRANYLCRRRLDEAIAEEGLLADADHPFRLMAAWSESGGSGDRADLPASVEDGLWSRVCSEADSCVALRCPHREGCHVLTVRRNAADAQIVVVNHHLLFADLSTRLRLEGAAQTSILPAYSALVLDEAHAVESSATSLFSESLSRFSVAKKLSKLWRSSKAGSFGALAKLAALPGMDADRFKPLSKLMREAAGKMADLESLALSLLGNESSLRLPPEANEGLAPLRELAGAFQRSLLGLSGLIAEILDAVPEGFEQDAAVYESRLASRSLGELSELASKFKDFSLDPQSVLWLEKGRTSQGEAYASLNSTPLEVASILEKSLFSKLRSVVCTSATLTVADSFAFWASRIGIEIAREDFGSQRYSSPFPFASNSVLAIDAQAPDPQKEKQRFKEYLSSAVISLLQASRGRALVLFTSYELLTSAYAAAKLEMEKLGIACLRQGMDDRSKLLSSFKTDISSVLFATDSFWEGVDAPGETLSMVIITKLPFRVPKDPVFEARAEAIERRGGSSFMELNVPEAIMRFKQGFGRLIRHSEDRGIAVVLDRRLATARYGRLFVESLPPCKLVSGDLGSVSREVESFLDA